MNASDPRSRLLKAAISLLDSHGPSEIKARSVASAAGLSTMGVYTYFGGVSELLQAIADEGFSRQLTIFKQVAGTDDPMTDLCAMALACRDFAKGSPHLYDLMFGLSIQGRYGSVRGAPSPEPKERSAAFQASYGYLLAECVRMIERGDVRAIDPDLMAAQLWAALHGFIMLELGGHFDAITDPSEAVLVPMCVNLIVGLGAERELANVSAATALSTWRTQRGRPAKRSPMHRRKDKRTVDIA